MLRITLGYWQIACAREVMSNAWELVKTKGYNMATALKKAWKDIKKIIFNTAKNYKEYKLVIGKKSYNLDTNTKDVDTLVDVAMEKIADVKGKNFLYGISNKFFSRYNKLISKFKKKGTLTFYKDVFLVEVK